MAYPPRSTSRRAFLRDGTLLLGGLALSGTSGGGAWAEEPGTGNPGAGEPDCQPALRFGAVSDVHYADLPAGGRRHFRQSPDKLAEAVQFFQTERPDFVVELGDFIDRNQAEAEQAIDRLRSIDEVFAQLPCPRHYVIGNHCAAWLTPEEFVEHSGARAPYYSFDSGRFHFVVLDSNYTRDGEPWNQNLPREFNIPPAECEWLAADLEATDKPTVVLAHQPLGTRTGAHVRNAAEVRQILADSGRVAAVFQGHIHRNDYVQIDGIHYCTLVAMVDGDGRENSGYCLVSLFDDASIRVEGFHRQPSHDLHPDLVGSS